MGPRHVRVWAAILLSALVFVPERAVGQSEGPVRLKFAFATIDEAEARAMLDAITAFNAANPDVRVEPVSSRWTGYGVHDSFVRFLALQDPSVDVFRLDLPWIAEFADPGWLLPLDDRIDAAPFLPDALLGGRYRGHLYGLPLSHKGNLLYYRTDLVQTVPNTLAELSRQSRALVARGLVDIGLAVHGLYLYNDFLPVLWGAGGDPLALDAPPAREAFQAFTGLFQKPPVAPAPAVFATWRSRYRAPLDAFRAGRAAFFVGWTADLRSLRSSDSRVRDRFGLARIPSLRGPGRANLGSYYLAVSAASRHPEVAARFATFVCSAPQQKRRWATLGELPSLAGLYDDPAIRGDRFAVAARAALAQPRTRPRIANERQVSAYLETALHAAIDGRATPAQALEKAAVQVRTALRPVTVLTSPPDPTPLIPPSSGRAAWLGWLFGGAALAVLVVSALLVVLRNRFRLRVLATLRSKMTLFGVATMLLLLLATVGLTTVSALRAQEEERISGLVYHHREMADQALTLGKNLALAASVVSDLVAADAPLKSAGLLQLMDASHFSDDLLFLQLLSPAGEVLRRSEDTLYMLDGGAGVAALPEDLPARVGQRRVLLVPRLDGTGQRYAEVIAPVFRRGVHAGALRLGVSLQRLHRRLEEVRTRHDAQIDRILVSAAGVAGLSLLFGVLAILLLARRITLPVVELTERAKRIRSGDLGVVIVPRTRDEIGTLAGTMAEMVEGLRDRDRIRETLGRYVTEEVAERFLSDPSSLQLGGQLQEVTILMSDLRGFTALSERLGPEAMVRLLNRYLARMTDVIFAHGGTINEFIGDAILALFGAPERGPDDAERAVRCAIAMQREMVLFNDENQSGDVPRLDMGIGLNSGTVIAGNIGSEKRAKYGVVGGPVNLAARVESFTTGTQVLMSEATFDRVRDTVSAAEPFEVHVKGSAEPLRIYEVRAIAGSQPLAMPEVPSAPMRPVDLGGMLRRIDGKEVSGRSDPIRVRRASTEQLVLDALDGLAPRDNVLLRLHFPEGRETGDIYAKVVRVETNTELTLAITSITPEDRDALSGSAQVG